MRAGRTRLRWTTLCAAALVVFQLGAILHLAAAPHGVCWEHGVVVDLDAAPAGHEALVPAPSPGIDSAPGPAVRSDAHLHCPALWVLRAGRSEFVVAAVPVAPPEPQGIAPAVPTREGPGGWTLRRAPKQSPPV
jgi:hypothetical protein